MPGYDDLTPGRDDAAEFDFGLDFDEERSRLLLVESAREAAAERSRFVGAVVTELVRISSDAGTSVAPVWAQMMSKYYAARGLHGGTWTPPLGVISAEMDRTTGTLATASTPPDRRYTEYFIEGTEPDALKLDPWTVFKDGALTF